MSSFSNYIQNVRSMSFLVSLCRMLNVQVILGVCLLSCEISKADAGILSYGGNSCLEVLCPRVQCVWAA